MLTTPFAKSDTASATRREELRDGLARVETELGRYAESIADVGPLDTILNAIRVREERRDATRHELKAPAPQGSGERDPGEIRATLGRYLADWTAMTRASVAEARGVLRDVLVDRIDFRPVPRPPELPPVKTGEARLRVQWRGVTVQAFRGPNLCKFDGPQRGFEPVCQSRAALSPAISACYAIFSTREKGRFSNAQRIFDRKSEELARDKRAV